ncbi:MAG: SDR family NAD(P)-dependent oxidoreductase [Proteobacteria bacterium]|nr:MAG: SDR family NAD(P)-dependent oxidoreductase [Pseudomonadota bacterium]
MDKRIAVVTGANRGLGWGTAEELAKQGYELVLMGRKKKELAERVASLTKADKKASYIELDLANPASIEAGAAELAKRYPGGVHVVVNNAGVFLENGKPYARELVKDTLQVNTLGPLQFAEAVGPLLRKTKGSLVNVSSGMGQLSDMGGGSPGYRISKTALNAVTKYLSAEWKEAGVRVNSICPGWVKTDMGGEGAERTIEEAVKGIVWAATIPPGGPTGSFFRDGKKIDW